MKQLPMVDDIPNTLLYSLCLTLKTKFYEWNPISGRGYIYFMVWFHSIIVNIHFSVDFWVCEFTHFKYGLHWSFMGNRFWMDRLKTDIDSLALSTLWAIRLIRKQYLKIRPFPGIVLSRQISSKYQLQLHPHETFQSFIHFQISPKQ